MNIDEFIGKVEGTEDHDIFTQRVFYRLDGKMFAQMCELLKDWEAKKQCLKTKCVICPHCSNCDVDENGQLKKQEARELTIDEWREWKANPKRNPICELWEHDTSPMWILNPNDVHEPALLINKLKLFTGKPTFEQCKEVKWE